MELYVGNLDYDISISELQDIFSQYGQITSVRRFIDCATRQRRDFGFVRMSTRKGGHQAIEGLNGKNVNNRNLIVNELVI